MGDQGLAEERYGCIMNLVETLTVSCFENGTEGREEYITCSTIQRQRLICTCALDQTRHNCKFVISRDRLIVIFVALRPVYTLLLAFYFFFGISD